MAVDVQEFYDMVSGAINRGTTYDSVIPTYVARAVSFLEQNYSFEYMKVVDRDFFQLIADQREYDQPYNMKKVNLWRIIKDDGKYLDLEKVNPKDLGNTNDPDDTDTVVPSTFYLEGRTSLILNVAPTLSYTDTEFHHEVFTDWTEVNLGDTPWLVENAEGLLLDQTVILMGSRLRNPSLIKLHLESKKENLRVMSLSEEDLEQGGEDPIMQYGGED